MSICCPNPPSSSTLLRPCILCLHEPPSTRAMSSRTNGFAQGTVLRVAYSMLGLTSSVILARIGLNILSPRGLIVSDYLVFLAFVFYAAMCALYITVSPYMQRVYGVLNGDIAPYAAKAEEAMVMSKMIFAAHCMFWATLWSIKFSLLLLYRKLLTGLHKSYTIIWWAIVGLCLLVSYLCCSLNVVRRSSAYTTQTFTGNYIMYFRSCGTISGFWRGGCIGNSAKEAQLASLYYSFTADTSTNVMSK
jgi:hypothetical protein